MSATWGKIIGGLEVFAGARPDDGLLDLGVVTAKNAAQWAGVLGHVALGNAIGSRHVKVMRGRKILIRFDRPVPYELDGGTRRPAAKLRVKAHPSSVTVCVPAQSGGPAGR